MSETVLIRHRDRWRKKPVLREIYEDYYRSIVSASRPGRSLEVGSGSGNLKEFLRQVVSTDIVPAPWLDAAADAQALPFAGSCFANVLGVDVLHHIQRPRRFLAEVERVLEPGGRMILVEPAITPISRVLYSLFHPEPVEMRFDPLADGPVDPKHDPWDSNQAIATLLCQRDRERLAQSFPGLRLLRADWLSLFAYPLSGGFRPWCLLPRASVKTLLRIERRLAPVLGRFTAFRLFIVIEKVQDSVVTPRRGRS